MTIILGEYQRLAVDNISKLDRKIYIITGGAGVGKTTVLQHLLIKLWGDENSGVTPETTYIGCPTGKSAKVVNDAMPPGFLENEAATLHRMLQFVPGVGWGYNEYNKINASVIICDESSMIGSVLLSVVIDAMPENCKLILVGDTQQLNPVDPGAPFHDLIHCGDQSTVYRLDKNYRQAQGSLIADGCLRILDGQKPTWGTAGQHTLGGPLLDDLFFIEEPEKEEIPLQVANLVRPWHEGGLDWICLAPQRTGVCGVEAMNKYLQEVLNPPAEGKPEIKVGWLTLRVGCKVLQTRNNYGLGESGVFNGFCGVVRSIGVDWEGKDEIVVDFDGQLVSYTEKKDIQDLALGYCLTVHKSQGSQFKYGVVICHSSHYWMWSRSLMYTGVSRFKKELYVIGDNKAVKRGISNVVSGERNTLIKLRLRGEM